MEVTKTRAGIREACVDVRASGAVVALVPTMGALHSGHRSLLARARREAGFVAMTMFVNPLQFEDTSDLAEYPRQPEQDLEVAMAEGCDLVFIPSDSEMFPGGAPEVTVDPGPLGDRLEGASRPGHFRGVLTVVAKLFDLAGPCVAYFGEKDAQQLELVRRMSRDLDMSVEIASCATVRDSDGLALSSRAAHMSGDERRAAAALHEALTLAARMAAEGGRDADVIRAAVARRIASETLARLDYVAAVDDRTWDEVNVIAGRVRLLVAAAFGRVRLIDNLALDERAE